MKHKKAVILLLFIGVMTLGAKVITQDQKNRLYDELDASRDEYRDNISSVDFYTIKDGDYVQSVSVSESFDDNNLSVTWFHTNVDSVNVRMDQNFENLSMRKKCEVCVQLMDVMRRNLETAYKSSRYYQIYSENKSYSSMRYRDISLHIYHETEFTFHDSEYMYTFSSYGNMAVAKRTSSHFKTYYEYSSFNGKIDDFGEKYGKSKKDNAAGNTQTNKTNTRNKETSDPYDVKKYNSSQSFADDKYEEFYDYEDYYDDEDEAYDDAEDYWDEYH